MTVTNSCRTNEIINYHGAILQNHCMLGGLLLIDSKKINIIAFVSAFLAVVLTIILIIFGSGVTPDNTPLYAEKIFGTDIISVDIIADETEWQSMLDNAINEEYIMADVIINGRKISNVGIRPKGNSSLQQVYSSDSDRYSFKIKFDEYVSGQTCFGLDMLVLNNMLGDATYMKEYLTFDMMKELGVTAPYFSYSEITVNGENKGFYFALEAYGDSFKQRISGDESGMLYNVKSMEMGGGMGGSSSGGTLEYSGGDASSYQAIFGNVVGAEGSDEDYARVITALKALNEGENIEEYFDVDEILRYLAVHTFVVNLDSYSSNMAQNYYIYEYDGVIKILPWDYNFAWGAFESGNASSTVNFPIDTPVSGVEMSARPLISKLFENEDYFALYHGYLRELTEKYFSEDEFSRIVNEIDGIIGGYVEKDTTAFYTYDEYKAALRTFIAVGNLRAESVVGQLDGTVPSTTAEQKASSEKLIDTSDISLSVMGTNGFGGGMRGGFRDIRNGNSDRADFANMPQDFPSDNFGGFNGTPPEIPNGNGNENSENNGRDTNGIDGFDGTPPEMPDGEFGGNMPPNMQNGNNNENSENNGNTPPNMPDGSTENSESGGRDTNGRGGFGNRPDRGGDRMGNMNGEPQQPDGTSEKSGIKVTAASLIALIIATAVIWRIRSKF